MQVESHSQTENWSWKSQSAQDAAEILGIDGLSEEVPTSAHVVLAAQLKLRHLRRELSARLSNSLEAYQVETGLNSKADLSVEHVWGRIRRVQAARDKLLVLRPWSNLLSSTTFRTCAARSTVAWSQVRMSVLKA